MRMTEEELSAYLGRKKPAEEKPKKKNKFNAISTKENGIRFASKLERDFYLVLKAAVKNGEILFFLMQVPINLKGATLRVDFFVVGIDRQIHVIDTKGGKITEAWKAKQRMVEARYPFIIRIIKRKEVDELMRFYGLKT